jgi:predicted CXXCH cytochrome family protein
VSSGRKVASITGLIGLLILGAVCCVALTLRWRGLRATSKPGTIETLIARSARNFAIPGNESKRTNPFKNDDLTIKQGRSLFLERCASCHGVDGRGATPLGSNVYPRVPDLRSASTQRLSDGALHYIIRDGIQFTAMPALAPSPHNDTDRDSWALVTYLRNLQAPETQAQQATNNAHYVGSAACEQCHADIYAHWKKTPMANVIRDPADDPNAIIPDLTTNKIAPFTKEQVAFTYGSLWKQRYFTRVGDDYYPLPAQWDIGNKKWMPYHVADKGADWWTAFYPSDNMQRPTGPTCDGCHSVGYDIATKHPVEWNVGCERCHGPGSEHAAKPTRTNILNPAAMDDVADNDICISCHSQGQPRNGLISGKAYDWPVGYQPGKRLSDTWKLEEANLGQTDFLHFPDGTAHKNRMQGNDFVQSEMDKHGVTCASCHDVHGTANYAQLRKPADQICLDCHIPGGANGPHTTSLQQHTHHKDGTPGAQCIACHMPKIETEGVPGAFVRSHTFRFITPAMTTKYNMPSPCTSCHKDKSPDWANAALLSWNNTSPWRVAQ